MNAIHPITPDIIVGERAVDVRRGTTDGTVSSQWHSRPDDQRFLSLNALMSHVQARRDRATERTIRPGGLFVEGDENLDKRLTVTMPDTGEVFAPTHYSFGQLASLAGMGRATGIFRGMPGWLAGMNLTYGFKTLRGDDNVKLYADPQAGSLLAATGPDYGRIYDASLVRSIQKFAGDGTGDTPWKVPGVINWSKGTYNPFVDITKETTTLFASDRDVFIFLVDDTRPIEVGTLPNGDPDLVFRGFYAWNSEVGSRSLGIATFWLRAVCQNRNLWGVEDMEDLRIIHTKYGADRFAREAEPALSRYATSEPTKLIAGIKAAKSVKVAADEEEALKVLTAKDLGFSLSKAKHILATYGREEGGVPTTGWDMTQAITAYARTIPHQDDRIDVEKIGAKLMAKAIQSAI